MRGQRPKNLARTLLLVLVAVAFTGCTGGKEADLSLGSAERAGGKSAEVVRAARRAYDGAPPVKPHEAFGMSCTECHNLDGVAVQDVGFSPPTPHELTAGLSAMSNCTQCHVAQQTEGVWRASDFEGLPQDLRSGRRRAEGAPPVMPHPRFMRENCRACHSGLAAREAIRTSHPDRANCAQCHVEQVETSFFSGS